MRKLTVLTLLVLGLFAATAIARGGASTFDAKLNGRSETPPTGSKATGRAEIKIARNGRSIRFELKATGLSGRPQMAHIHLGPPGQPGGIVLAIATKPFSLPREGRLTARQFTPVGSVKTFAQAVRAIRAGRTYVNIHTKKFPAGEIRGPLRPHR